MPKLKIINGRRGYYYVNNNTPDHGEFTGPIKRHVTLTVEDNAYGHLISKNYSKPNF